MTQHFGAPEEDDVTPWVEDEDPESNVGEEVDEDLPETED